MATTPIRGIECPDRILIPMNQLNLLDAIKAIANDRQFQNTHKSVLSIQHKLNVAMYQAALISELKPEHFTLFDKNRNASNRELKFSEIAYKICSYSMGDIDEYLFILSFLIETFAATVFSLFDVSGSLINQLYMLNLKERDVSFTSVMQKLQSEGRIDSQDIVFRFLYSYFSTPDQPDYASKALREITWVKPMKEIRNRTTHRPITDVCDIDERKDVYSSIYQGIPEINFLIDNSIYPNKKLCDFVREVFNGVEEFVEDFFFYLREAVQRSSDLPIY